MYAEDPSKGFIPKPGSIDELVWAGGAGEAQTDVLRIESGVRAGSKVTPIYDPMVAKVVAWGETRTAAIDELARALEGTTIAPCTTNLAFLGAVLASPEFRAGTYDTRFAEGVREAQLVKTRYSASKGTTLASVRPGMAFRRGSRTWTAVPTTTTSRSSIRIRFLTAALADSGVTARTCSIQPLK